VNVEVAVGIANDKKVERASADIAERLEGRSDTE
jgi:hypothetical protein